MTRLRRLCAVIFLASASVLTQFSPALADHCPPIDNPDPVPGQNTTYCHTPRPTPPPATPKATPKPAATPAPTVAPRPVAPPAGPTRPTTQATPAPSPFDIEVPEEEALATPEIVIDGPGIEDGESFDVAEGERTASASSWIFGFVVGFIIGGLFGRASWGVRRRRRQQIFG